MLSALAVTRDSAPWLPYFLANMRSFADEVVVVVDRGSTDNTLAIARDLADRVEEWEVGGYQELVLQKATELCRGDWIMRLDDDELMPPEFIDTVQWLMQRAVKSPTDDYDFRRLSLVEDGSKVARSPDIWPDFQVRLRTAEAYHTVPWGTAAHFYPPARQRWTVSTDDTTIWHMRHFVRSEAELRARQIRIWRLQAREVSRIDAFLRSLSEPWQILDAPSSRPAELDALLAALGHPCWPVKLLEHTPANHMRASRGGNFILGLQSLTDTLPPETVMVEVGVFAGESSRVFMASGRVKTLYGVDPWGFQEDNIYGAEWDGDTVERSFDQVIADFPGQIFKIKDFSPQAAVHFGDDELDAVYIDGDHSYAAVLADIQGWWPKVRAGGLVTGHDYSVAGPDVVRAVNKVFGAPDHVYPDTSWVVRKTPERKQL
jgi:hypothetical protein